MTEEQFYQILEEKLSKILPTQDERNWPNKVDVT